MVTVARVSGPTVSESAVPLPGVTTRADPNAAAGLARGLESVAGVIDRYAQAEQAKAETAQVLEARRKLSDWQRTWFDPANEKGVYGRKGRDALGLAEEIEPDFERVRSELAQSLRSPRAQQAFASYADAQRESILDRVNAYSLREHDGYVAAEFEASIASESDLAAQAAMEGRADDLTRHVQEGLRVIRARGATTGAPAEATAQQEAAYLASVHATAIDGFLAAGDVGAASAHFAEHGDDLTPSVRAEVLSKMNPLLVDAMVDHVEAAVTHGRPMVSGALPAAGAAGSLREAEAIAVASVGRTVQLESAGKADARNPRSSAEGPAQFIDATWYDMLARHRPELVAGVPKPGPGRPLPQEVVELKRDPKLAGLMATEYAKENARFLYESGLPVTEETIYLAHRFGPGGAAQLLRAPPSASIASLVSPKVMAANPDLKGKTVADLSASHAARAGEAPSPVLAAVTGQSVPEALRAQAKATPNIRLRRALEQRADRIETEAEVARNRAERAMQDSIWETVGRGEELTPDQRAFARDHRMEGSIEAERLRQVRGTLVQDDPVLVDALHREALDSPDTFSKRVLSSFTDRLSTETRARLSKMQADIMKPETRAELVSDAGYVERMAMVLGYEGEGAPEAKAVLRHGWLQAREAFRASVGRDPTAAERDRLAQEVQQQFLADPKGKARRVEAALLHNVSGSDYAIVAEELKATTGKMPTDAEVRAKLAAYYRRDLGPELMKTYGEKFGAR